MTRAPVERTDHARILSALALGVGLILLADSISQLIQAAGALEIGNRSWRVNALRLAFTQVTPLLVALLLVGQFLVRRANSWRASGRLALGVATLVLGLAAVYARDATATALALDGPALGQLRRSMVQVMISAGALGLGFLVGGIVALRSGEQEMTRTS